MAPDGLPASHELKGSKMAGPGAGVRPANVGRMVGSLPDVGHACPPHPFAPQVLP